MPYKNIQQKETVLFLFGSEFEASVLPMILIMPVVLLTGMTRVMGNQILIPKGQERIVLYSVVSGAVADIILNAILIPRFGPSGAVIGTLAAELIIVLVQFPRVRGEVGGTVRRVLSWRIALAIILSMAASIWVKLLQVGLLWKLIISCLLFFAVYNGILLFTKEPMAVEAFQWIKGKVRRR